MSVQGLTSHSTHNRSFRRRVFPSFQAINCTGTDNQKQSNTTLHTPEAQKRNRKKLPQLTKQSTPWSGTPFTTSGQETEWAYSCSPGAHTGQPAVWAGKTERDLVVEHDGLVLVARLELVVPGRFNHVIWLAQQRHVQQLVIKTVLLYIHQPPIMCMIFDMQGGTKNCAVKFCTSQRLQSTEHTKQSLWQCDFR